MYVPEVGASKIAYDCALQISRGDVVLFDPFVVPAVEWKNRDLLRGKQVKATGYYNDEDVLIVETIKFL